MILEKIAKLGIAAGMLLSLSSCRSNEVYLSESVSQSDNKIRMVEAYYPMDGGVQDEARIKCKSKEMKIRYFLFLFEQMLQTIWICFYKDQCSFKEFLIALSKASRGWTKTKE